MPTMPCCTCAQNVMTSMPPILGPRIPTPGCPTHDAPSTGTSDAWHAAQH